MSSFMWTEWSKQSKWADRLWFDCTWIHWPDVLAEGLCHRNVGHRPRNVNIENVFWPKAIFTHLQRQSIEYGLRPNVVRRSTSWGVAPGYDDEGLRPKNHVAEL